MSHVEEPTPDQTSLLVGLACGLMVAGLVAVTVGALWWAYCGVGAMTLLAAYATYRNQRRESPARGERA